MVSDIAARLLRVVERLRDETHPGRTHPVRLESSLERELGFDSLARSELLLRLEKEFGVALPHQLLATAETPRDFLIGLEQRGDVAPPTSVPPPFALAMTATEEWLPAPADLESLTAVLEWHAAHQPERTHLIFIDEADAARPVSYGRLWIEARTVAAALRQREVGSGDAVALMLPTCIEFFPCFFGILLAGAVPVPIYPPARPSQLEDHLRRHAAILANAGARWLIASSAVARPAALLRGQVDCLRGVLRTEDLLATTATDSTPAPVRPDDLALLQYTSGSTGNPKGVMLSHAQLLANIHAMARAARVRQDDVFVSWLPLYHDMGLICAWLSSLVYAMPFVVMSPLSFLARPVRWLQAIQTYRGTLSGAPNFAYELCLKRIDDAELVGLDLSSWRLAFSGAEPVSPATVTRFAERFAACGLRRAAIAPVYGLAECAVGLTLTIDRGALIDRIRRAPFVAGGQAIPAGAEDEDAMRFVACGRPLPGYEVRIADAVGAELPERHEGRVQFRGPSATAGYYRNPQATALLIRDGWHDTGDHGYLAGGELYLTGRAKDIIIKAGRNIYPQEVEEAVGNLPGIRKGCVAVFGSPDPVTGTERLVVAAETRETEPAARERMRQDVYATVVELLGVPADDVVLSTSRIVLKTSSGKVRRAASRELYESGGIGYAAPRAVWLQVARLLISGMLPQIRRGARAAAGWLHGLWAASLFCVIAVPVWVAVTVAPTPTIAWGVCRVAARLWLRVAGIGLTVSGIENLDASSPHVVVINHASYIDGIALIAALPYRGWRFVAKRELLDGFVSRLFLRRFGCEFVERFDFEQGVADASRLAADVASGSLAFFPEGTFTRVPGLRPFRMGAFFVAAQTGTPVLPVAIAGARDVLRDGNWLPRRGTITVTLSPAILPQGIDWAAAIALRDAARAEILGSCGEGDLPV